MAATFFAEHDQQTAVLRVVGDIEGQASIELRKAIEEHTDQLSRPLRVDLTAVTFLPSSAVGVLAIALRDSDGRVELAAGAQTIAGAVLRTTAVPFSVL